MPATPVRPDGEIEFASVAAGKMQADFGALGIVNDHFDRAAALRRITHESLKQCLVQVASIE